MYKYTIVLQVHRFCFTNAQIIFTSKTLFYKFTTFVLQMYKIFS